MKKYRCSKLTALLLAIIMVISTMPAALAATGDAGEIRFLIETRLNDGFVTPEPVIKDQKGQDVKDFSKADPNGSYILKLSVRNPGDEGDTAKTLPEDSSKVRVYYELENMMAADGSNGNGVSWTYDAEKKQVVFTWPEGAISSFDADIAVIPAYPAAEGNDLSGSYVLGTAGNTPNQYTYRVMMTPNPFMDGKRGRLKGVAFEEVDGKVYILSEDAASVWELKHVSGNYYTVRSRNTGKYLKFDVANNGLLLEEATDFTAQKIMVEEVNEGYYAFIYQTKSINNSSFSATKGFAAWNSTDRGGNAILKLYNPSDVITEPIRDLSGTWVITNAARKNVLTAQKHSTDGRLAAVDVSLEGNYLITDEDITTFTFENIIRDWYTVKTDSGYLNINNNKAFISSTPQHLVVVTKNQYDTIIISNGELYDTAYVLTNINGATANGYGAVQKHVYDDNTNLKLIPTTNILGEKPEATLSFNMNGGSVSAVPEDIAGASGQKVVLPDLNGTKDGNAFIGWCEVNSVYLKNAGTNHTYHDVYKAGTTYTLKSGTNILYAIYNDKGTKVVRFGIRKDGVIQDEPNGYSVNNYIGHFEVSLDILKETHWVIDIDSTKNVNGYYLENNVTANLNWVPSAEQIADALKKEGNVVFDPETQYIHYYVMKNIPDTTWKIDGVIRDKTSVEITYNTNVPGTEKTTIKDMPGSYQVMQGTTIYVGTNKDSDKVLRPTRSGYVFNGWNSEPDGTGTKYSEGQYLVIEENINLYAQWIDVSKGQMVIRIESSWPDNKPTYVGTEITLTAKLTGFENRIYTLQWQYKTDDSDWIDIPDTNSKTYTYYLDEINTNYTWRCVARDVK